jgi:small-conductance mechanosensitive channel
MNLRTPLQTTFFGNAMLAWIIAAGILVLVTLLLMLVRQLLVQRGAKLATYSATRVDDFLVAILRHTHGLFLFAVALSAASLALALPLEARHGVRIFLGASVILQLLVWGNAAIALWLKDQTAAKPGALGTMTAIAFMARLLLWVIAILLLLDNFGLQVTTLIAALGVGGIAVALAAQTILGDLFAAISIYLDQPFEVGEFIAFDEYLGTVKNVGLRSTTIQSLWGEVLVVSNADLLKSRIKNYARMKERRVSFVVGAAYGTPRALVQAIPGLIRAAVEEQKQVRFDRSHFRGYGDSSLDFETVYYVLSPDYNIFMDIQQAINLRIMERFEEQGIAFAHPIRVVKMPAATATPDPVA